jgi:hypothetical protein
MSITGVREVACGCGARLQVEIVESLNGGRHPALRRQVLDRTLHVFACAACGTSVIVEAPVFYFDFDRRQMIGAYPAAERADARVRAEQLYEVFCQRVRDDAPPLVRARAADFLVRVCFGYEELREKLVADDAGLSDLVLEALKCRLFAADERLRASGAATLRLDEVTPEGALVLVGDWLAPPPALLRLTVPRAAYDAVAAERPHLLELHPGLASGPHVSMLRLVPWPGATAAG